MLQGNEIYIESWPDVSEFPSDALKDTGLKLKNGQPAMLFSSVKASVSDKHFQWMHDKGVDGAFQQRFISDVQNAGEGQTHFNQVLKNVQTAAEAWGRTYCVMYDVRLTRTGFLFSFRFSLTKKTIKNSGTPKLDPLKADFDFIRTFLDNFKSPSYLRQNGKPVVVIWGFGFNDGNRFSV